MAWLGAFFSVALSPLVHLTSVLSICIWESLSPYCFKNSCHFISSLLAELLPPALLPIPLLHTLSLHHCSSPLHCCSFFSSNSSCCCQHCSSRFLSSYRLLLLVMTFLFLLSLLLLLLLFWSLLSLSVLETSALFFFAFY